MQFTSILSAAAHSPASLTSQRGVSVESYSNIEFRFIRSLWNSLQSCARVHNGTPAQRHCIASFQRGYAESLNEPNNECDKQAAHVERCHGLECTLYSCVRSA